MEQLYKYYNVYVKEVGKDLVLTPSLCGYYNHKDCIDFFGLENSDVVVYMILEDHIVGDTIYFEDKNGHIVSGVVKQVNDGSYHDKLLDCQIDYKEYVVNVYDDVDTIVNSWECVDGN